MSRPTPIRLVLLVLLGALAAALWWRGPAWFGGSPQHTASAPSAMGSGSGGGGKHKADAAARPIPVTTADVERKSVPVSFPATGTIEAVATVAVRSRIDGQVIAVKAADGASVAAGDVLLEIDPRLIDAQIAAARASLTRDQATRDKAARDLARAHELVQRNAATAVAEADAKTALDLAEATLAADQATLASLETQREFYTIRAPLAGRIGLIAVQPGATVRAADTAPLVTVNAFDPVYAAVGVPQNEIARLAAAARDGIALIRVTVPGAAPDAAKPEGKITVIGNEADPGTGLITVRARIANEGPALWPGEVVDAEVVTAVEADALVIPSTAVQTGQNGPYVYVVDDKSVAHLRPVAVARTVAESSIIASGLTAGEKVVTDGQLQLTDKAQTATLKAASGD